MLWQRLIELAVLQSFVPSVPQKFDCSIDEKIIYRENYFQELLKIDFIIDMK